MTQLKSIPVAFDEERHLYTDTRNGKQLLGITSTLLHRLFPDKYRDIPAHILAQAADRGSVIHEDIELAETLGTKPSTEEGKNYLKLKAENDMKFLAAEHLVSDLTRYASNIDLIFDVEENVVDIADIKTTSKFDRESTAWQLSIYAYFLELNNPEVKVRNLYGLWLRKDIAERISLRRHTVEEVQDLIQADTENREYNYSPAFPEYIVNNEQTLYSLAKKIKDLTEEYEALKAKVMESMSKNKDKSFDLGNMVITLSPSSSRAAFDSKLFKQEHEDLYAQYTKKAPTKETLRITLR